MLYMMDNVKRELSEYEKMVEAAIYEVAEPYKSRLKISREDAELGFEWKIVPTNSKAADITVYGVDEVTINMSVDHIYWLEIFMKKNKWDQDIEYFKKHLLAIMQGKIKGWYRKATLSNQWRDKTLLVVDTGIGKPHEWSGNILFTGAFKKKPGVIKKEYESY